MNMTKNYLFVHGYKGAPDIPAWQLWVADEIRKKTGAVTSVPQMPYPESPVLEAWLRVIFRAVHEVDFPESTFIGHSLGGVAILKALEESAEPADHIVLIGVPFTAVKPQIAPFFETPLDFELLKSKAKKITCLYSKDDPYVPFEHGKMYAEKLGAELVSFDNKGHFEDMSEFPELVFRLFL